MGDGKDCALFEFVRNNFLNNSIVLDIDVGSGLIHQDYFTMLEKGSADTQQLLFSC
jgi:hypothetical protein